MQTDAATALVLGDAGVAGAGDDAMDEAPNRPVAAMLTVLGATASGLDTEEALARYVTYGPNTIREPAETPMWRKFVHHFVHEMAALLWVAGVIAFAAQLPQLGIAIWLVNVINGIFSFYQEFKAAAATAALKSLLPLEATVIRDGREQRVNAESIVPGDVLLLEEGDRVTADLLLLESAGFYVNQSNFTGESKAVRKVEHPEGHGSTRGGTSAHGGTPLMRTEYPNLVFASTNVVSGSARGVVLRTGMATEFGKVAEVTQDIVSDISPLQREVSRTCKIITAIALFFGVLFFLLAYFLARVELIDAFIYSLGMVVAFVPEGMLPLVTLCLAVGTQRMAKRHVVVKKLSSVETLGSTTIICSDKTGTLTQNELTVRRMWAAGREVQVSGVGFEPEGQFSWVDTGADVGTPSGVLRRALMGFAVCNNSRLVPPGPENERHTILGDPTEGALKVAAMKAGIDVSAELGRQVRIVEIPFTSDRRRMTTIHEVADESSAEGERVYAYVKGSPDEIISRCTKVQWSGSEVRDVDAEMRKTLLGFNDTIASRGLRVLAIAYRELPAGSGASPDEVAAECELTFLGLSGMMDPPRPEVPGAIERCRTAGIRVVMITGDYGLTASSIAAHIGLGTPGGPAVRVITGNDMKAMDDSLLKTAIQEDCIFARVVPADKLRVVRVFQELGHTVAVTGDGVNDAPALKQANIGVAMGITGTDVAKDAADMILTDDNFASIVAAVEEGRGAYANIRNFLTYILISNFAEAFPFMVFVLSKGRIALALSVLIVLGIDLGTDLIPALALGADPPEPGIMSRKPRSRNDHLVDRTLIFRAFGLLGPLEALAAMLGFFFHYWVNGHEGQILDLPRTSHILHSAQATAFIAVVFAQVGNLIACRTTTASIFSTGYSLFNNRLIWIGILSEIIIAVMITTVPFLQGFFGTEAVPFYPNWVFCIVAFTPLLLIADEIRKFAVWRLGRDKAGQFARMVEDENVHLHVTAAHRDQPGPELALGPEYGV
jgi:Ca2+-transporting ATPase